MNGEQPVRRDERTDKVRDFVWHMRAKIEQSQVHMGEVTVFLGRLDQRRDALRRQAAAQGSRGDGDRVLDEVLAELDGTQEEIRVVGEEMQRRGEQLLAWEAEAAAKLRFHRMLIERAPMAFFLTDENGMIADANEEAARMLHVTASYLRGKPIVNFVARRDVGNARTFLRAVARSERVLENVVAFRPRHGGEVCATEVRACALERDGEHALGWLVREVRSETADGAAAGSARARDPSLEALAIVSHELRAPLQTIESAVHLLRRSLPASHEPTRAEACCESILRAARAMNRLTADLLDAARVEAGRFSLELAPCDLRLLVEEVVAASEGRAALRGMELVVELPPAAVLIDGDFVRLTQVVANLLDNAFKFTSVGEGKRIVVGLTVYPELARLDVRDQGSGIAAVDMDNLFERHWQAPGTAKLGSGFGLWLARAITEAHGGTLTATSVLGEGTTLRLELPLSRA